MDVSVTFLRQHCLELVRRVETTGKPVTITRCGKIVARLVPPPSRDTSAAVRPWEKLRGLGGQLLAEPGELVLCDEDFRAMR